MLTSIVGTVALAVFYGFFWHNQSAREINRTPPDDTDKADSQAVPGFTRPRGAAHKRLLPAKPGAHSNRPQPRVVAQTHKREPARFFLAMTILLAAFFGRAQENSSMSNLTLEPALEAPWVNAIGHGFESKAQSLTLSAGATYGLDIVGSRHQHHPAIASLIYLRSFFACQ